MQPQTVPNPSAPQPPSGPSTRSLAAVTAAIVLGALALSMLVMSIALGVQSIDVLGESSTDVCSLEDASRGECQLEVELKRRTAELLRAGSVAVLLGTLTLGLAAVLCAVLGFAFRRRRG